MPSNQATKKVPDDSLSFAVMFIIFGLVLWGGPVAVLAVTRSKAPEMALLLSIFTALNLLALICFGWMAADPRYGWASAWQAKWRIERREGNSRLYVAALLFCYCGFWAWFGIFMARLSVEKRNDRIAQLDREDARWLKADGNHA